RVERGQKRQHEPSGGSGGHHHLVRVDVQRVAVAVVPGDGATQRGNAGSGRVAEDLLVEGRVRGGEHRLRRGSGRLTGGEVVHRKALLRPGLGRGPHLHHIERLDGGPGR